MTITVSNLEQACRSACSQLTDITKPEEEGEEEGEEDVKKTLSVEVC